MIGLAVIDNGSLRTAGAVRQIRTSATREQP